MTAYQFLFRGECLPVSNMFDEFGNETDDPDDADFIVAQQSNGEWLAARVSSGELREARSH